MSGWWSKPKLVAAGVGVLLLILLLIVLPIALTLSHRKGPSPNNASALFGNETSDNITGTSLSFDRSSRLAWPATFIGSLGSLIDVK